MKKLIPILMLIAWFFVHSWNKRHNEQFVQQNVQKDVLPQVGDRPTIRATPECASSEFLSMRCAQAVIAQFPSSGPDHNPALVGIISMEVESPFLGRPRDANDPLNGLICYPDRKSGLFRNKLASNSDSSDVQCPSVEQRQAWRESPDLSKIFAEPSIIVHYVYSDEHGDHFWAYGAGGNEARFAPHGGSPLGFSVTSWHLKERSWWDRLIARFWGD